MNNELKFFPPPPGFQIEGIRIRNLDETIISHQIDEQVHQQGQERLRNGQWDGEMYRLTTTRAFRSPIEDVYCDNELNLSQTTYATVMGYRQTQEYQLPSHTNLSTAACGIVYTHDGSRIILGRNNWGEYKLFGGCLQPSLQEITSGRDIEGSLREELYEEAGIEAEHVADINFAGILQPNKRHASFAYHVRLAKEINTTELAQTFLKRTDPFEVTRLCLYSREGYHQLVQELGSYWSLLPLLESPEYK